MEKKQPRKIMFTFSPPEEVKKHGTIEEGFLLIKRHIEETKKTKPRRWVLDEAHEVKTHNGSFVVPMWVPKTEPVCIPEFPVSRAMNTFKSKSSGSRETRKQREKRRRPKELLSEECATDQ
ncbi:MAG: uncharacterized protein A8A55_1268 [Amphiamblys sp. WSBS2006]|nr:MAG: uncharacterized protein A8A55_1268 [Amphiamblys sp. WSBS2006]